jgi:uncharacterized protein (DUF1501 family)
MTALGMLPLGLGGWVWGGGGPGHARTKRLIVVFLRGAVDGLSVVAPYTDPLYFAARPRIALPKPGTDGGLIDLDGRFGLHPALERLVPLWKSGSLAFVHACGSPDPTRSHFDAQDYMESGLPGRKGTVDGWMNRLLSVLPAPHGPTQAVSFGPTIPRILEGHMAVSNMALERNAAKLIPVDRPRIGRAFDALYSGRDALSVAYQQGQEARQTLLDDLDQVNEERQMADHGAPSPVGFGKDTDQLARMLALDPSIKLAFLALGGWDTHINQGAQLANHLRPLAEGLTGLVQGLGDAFADTTILVMSEFGRTFRENGDAGTDHGHGNVMWVLGGNVQGGKVYGTWPGLGDDQLYQKRDLAVTTDFRTVVGSVLTGHLGLMTPQLARVLPGMPPADSSLAGLIRPTKTS